MEAPDGPLLIFAGAGSGKTRVLTHRIAYILATRDVRPHEVLAVTFTNKAAKEMRSRIETLLGGSTSGMWIGTFHALGARILRRDGSAIGIPAGFSIYDEADRAAALKRAISAAGLDDKRFPVNKVGHAISAAKNELLDAQQFTARATGAYWEATVAQAYVAYEAEMRAADALDFDDLLVRTVNLLRQSDLVREDYQTRFRHLFVDEYQDTNLAQYVLVKLLAEQHRNLTVVGDDDQCVAGESLVLMGDGTERSISTLVPGDHVMSSFGTGDLRPAKVLRVHRSAGTHRSVRISTASGRQLTSTAAHTHFAGYRPFDTEASAQQLLADYGLDPTAPHVRPRSRNSNRRNVVLTLCGDRRGRRPMHRIGMVGNDALGRRELEDAGFSVRPAKGGSDSWRFETALASYRECLRVIERLRGVFGEQLEVFKVGRLGRESEGEKHRSLPFTPAGSVSRGMAMFGADGELDIVEKVERDEYEGDVVDIDVEDTHNYIANGLITHNSIYGWRGADVRNILSFERDYPDAMIVTLEQNYRSTQMILDAAHGVISKNPDRAPKRLRTDTTGGEPIRLISVYDEQEEALAVAGEVDMLIGREGFSLSDIAVLYRTNAQSRAFEDVLLRRGIPYRLVGGLRFYERREVKDVLAYLRLISNPRDAVSFARVVNVPRRKIGDRTVAEVERLARRKRISPFEAASRLEDDADITPSARQALDDFGRLIDSLHTLSQTVPLPQFLERVLDDTGYRRMLADGTPENTERLGNVEELLGLASEYADVPPPEGLAQFLENVALVADVDTLDDNAKGVTLITLHQVKGLEFPVVFIAGIEEGLLPHMRALEEGDAGIAEERRLMYVGITRAQRRLYVLHAFRRHLHGAPMTADASRFLADLPAEVLDIVRRPGGPAPTAPRTPGAARAAIHAHAVRPNPVEVAPQRYREQMRIAHPKLGEGTILKSTMTRSGEEVVIRFDHAGVKIFSVADSAIYPLPQ